LPRADQHPENAPTDSGSAACVKTPVKHVKKYENKEFALISVNVGCGSTFVENITYFESTALGDESGDCLVRICKVNR
jgi:hypothetical protein